MAAATTQLLTRIADGDHLAVDRLLPSVYEELRASSPSTGPLAQRLGRLRLQLPPR